MEVKLVSYTPNPLAVIAYQRGKMRGKVYDINTLDRKFLEEEFIDSTKTMLFGPFEAVHFLFDFIGVTRAFTHQLVRTRQASYSQESLRFGVKSGEKFKYLPITWKINTDYDSCMQGIQTYYEDMIKNGCPSEDARGVLPTNILTTLTQDISYAALIHTAESRLCNQTQGEHREAMLQIKKSITNIEPLMGNYLKPSCGHLGFCSWESYMDRPCPLQKLYPLKSDVAHNHELIKAFLDTMKVHSNNEV